MNNTMKLLVAVILFMSLSCGGHQENTLKMLPPVTTTLQTVNLTESHVRIEAPGQITSDKDAMVSAKSMGTVIDVNAKAGDIVKKGQSLLKIDNSDILSKLQQAKGAKAQAEAALAISENNLKRFKALYEKNACSKVELEQMEYQYNTAKGAVEMAEGAVSEAKSYLKYASVTAPFDALIVERMVNAGEFTAPGRPLFRIIDPKNMRFECIVSEKDALHIKLGDTITVVLDNHDNPLEGTVSEISAGSDFLTHSSMVRINLEQQSNLKAGMYGLAHFKGIPKQRIIIPTEWIVKRGELSIVFILGNEGKAVMTLVRTGRTFENGVEILSGLKKGDRIATTHLNKISDGIKLEAN